MKKSFVILSSVVALFLTSCTQDSIITQETNAQENNITTQDTNARRIYPIASSNERRIPINRSTSNLCFSTNLITKKGRIVGKVAIYKSNDTILLNYTIDNTWKIAATNLSIGTYGEHEFPVNKSGHLKPKKFQYQSINESGVSSVDYLFTNNDFGDVYWFAAHAVITNSKCKQKNVWAEGDHFNGDDEPIDDDKRNKKDKNWAMYVILDKNDCVKQQL